MTDERFKNHSLRMAGALILITAKGYWSEWWHITGSFRAYVNLIVNFCSHSTGNLYVLIAAYVNSFSILWMVTTIFKQCGSHYNLKVEVNYAILTTRHGNLVLSCQNGRSLYNILSPSRWYQVPVMNPWPPYT